MADDTGRALSGEQQVDAEAAPLGGDCVEAVANAGLAFDQKSELVDHDQEVRHHHADLVCDALQRDDIGDASGLQHAFAAVDLRVERRERPGGERDVVLEIGHQSDDVREPHQGSECRSPFVVDEEEGETIRRVTQRECRKDGLE